MAKGEKNSYKCTKCWRQIITVDSDDGTTPMGIRCRATRGCDGLMQSAFYRNVTGEPTFEWRKPTAKEYRKATPAMKQHFDMGGLDIFPINQ
jgi:DNA-directed RNA polymerase subunit RPC12/RpoP